MRVCLNIYVRKEKEDLWLNVIETKMAFVEDQLNFSSKSVSAVNFHVMESLLLYNWPKNSNVNIDVIYYLCSQHMSICFLLRVLGSKLISQPR